MRSSGRAAFSLIAVIAGSLAALVVLDVYAPRDGLPRFTPGAPLDSSESGPPGAQRPAGGAAAAGFPVFYKFHDLEEKEREISCTVDEKSYRKAVDGFGYPADQNAVWKELDKRLKRYVQEEIRRQGLREYLKDLTVSSDPGEVWNGKVSSRRAIPNNLPEPQKVEIRKKIKEFDEWVDRQESEGKAEEIANDYYRERGFIRGKERNHKIDFVNHAVAGTEALLPCFQSLKQEAGEEDKFRQLFFLTSLLQEMPYEPDIPLTDESGIVKAGFRVPADVMVGQKGDCDSKSVAFAAMWRNHPEPVLLVHESNFGGRDHTLVAVEPVPGVGPAYFFTAGLRRFVLCEVAGTVKGTKKLHPGFRYESGTYRPYDCVPPAGMEESDPCVFGSPWERKILDFLRRLARPFSSEEEPPAVKPPAAPPAQTG